MTNMPKKVLILKATRDICGNEVSLMTSHCRLLGMSVFEEDIGSILSLRSVVEKHSKEDIYFDYLYLCTHGNPESFIADMDGEQNSISWAELSTVLCENGTLNDDGVVLLACCKGGFFQVACDIFACCNSVSYVCGVNPSVA